MAASYPGANNFIQQSINQMYHATADDRGTVQALARELDDANKDGKNSGLKSIISRPSYLCTI